MASRKAAQKVSTRLWLRGGLGLDRPGFLHRQRCTSRLRRWTLRLQQLDAAGAPDLPEARESWACSSLAGQGAGTPLPAADAQCGAQEALGDELPSQCSREHHDRPTDRAARGQCSWEDGERAARGLAKQHERLGTGSMISSPAAYGQQAHRYHVRAHADETALAGGSCWQQHARRCHDTAVPAFVARLSTEYSGAPASLRTPVDQSWHMNQGWGRAWIGTGAGIASWSLQGRALSSDSHANVEGAGPNKKEQISVTFVNRDGSETTIEVPLGMNMLEAAHDNDIDLEGACEGSLACSTCHVVVEDEAKYEMMPEPSEEENDMLDLAFGLTPTSRLGCQVVATRDLEGMRLRIPSSEDQGAVARLNLNSTVSTSSPA